MGALLSAAVSRLGRPDAIRKQVLLYIFIARNHNIIKSSYEQYLGAKTARSSSSSEEQQSHSLWREKREQRATEGKSPPRETGLITHDDQHGANMTTREWDWRGFPARWRYFALYDFISTTWLIWVTVRSLFLDQLAALVDPLSRWLLDMPGNCLVPGRAGLPLIVSHLFVIVLTGFHLSWRFIEALAKRNRLLTMVIFLLVSERDLERFYSLLEVHHESHHEVSEKTPDIGDNESDETERLLKQVMCYQVHSSGDNPEALTTVISYKLRPNRTREARGLLMRRMAIVGMVSIYVSAVSFLALDILIVFNVLSDYRYAHVYPGCTPLLDEQLAQGKLTLWPLLITRTEHRLISGLIDLIESNILLLDWMLAVAFVPALCYLLNYDLLLYWTHIDRKLKLVLERESHYYYNDEQVISQQPDWYSHSVAHLPLSRHYNHHYQIHFDIDRVATIRRRQLKCDIDQLHSELCDFIQQVKCADLLIGDVLTESIIIWLSACAFLNYNLLVYDSPSLRLIMKFVLPSGYFVVTLVTYHLLELRRRCELTYRLLFKLMARDQAHTRRQSFIRLLDFYLDRYSATSYHLFRAYAYKSTTFIAIIGWSISSYFVVFTLFGEHKERTSRSGSRGVT